jgi:hypothetical protein
MRKTRYPLASPNPNEIMSLARVTGVCYSLGQNPGRSLSQNTVEMIENAWFVRELFPRWIHRGLIEARA